MRKKSNITALIFLFPFLMVMAQEEKIWISGAARAIMYGDSYGTDSENDTTTARKSQSGHALVDLGINIHPNENILITGMLRVRNDYGGFWGSGVTFDVRQLTVKGILGGFLKYQIGDIDYKLSNYTFYNQKGLVDRYEGVMTSVPLQQLQYDLFYLDQNTWRQQGASIDFAIEADKIIQEAEFNLFTTRVMPTDFGGQDDRLYSGGSVVLKQSKNLLIGGQIAQLYDFKGTSNSLIHLRNAVMSGNIEYRQDIQNGFFSVAVESGKSNLRWVGDSEAPELNDFFYDFGAKAGYDKWGLVLGASYRDVGAQFRSPGAQTMQINYARAPLAYQRIGNDKGLRPFGMLDLYRDASLYNTQISEGLAVYDPRYDNATPYGRATPNRRGFEVDLTHLDQNDRWTIGIETSFLSEIVGEGTTALKQFQTNSIHARLNFHNLFNIPEREVWVSARFGQQNTSRNGDFTYEEVDLATQFGVFNLSATIFGEFDLIAEYRMWASEGFELVAERNQYSEIIDFSEYRLNYNEDISGLGLQHKFNEKNIIRFMWQRFNWKDDTQTNLSYKIDTWSLFFTMRF